jgi:hypothetical protein
MRREPVRLRMRSGAMKLLGFVKESREKVEKVKMAAK